MKNLRFPQKSSVCYSAPWLNPIKVKYKYNLNILNIINIHYSDWNLTLVIGATYRPENDSKLGYKVEPREREINLE